MEFFYKKRCATLRDIFARQNSFLKFLMATVGRIKLFCTGVDRCKCDSVELMYNQWNLYLPFALFPRRMGWSPQSSGSSARMIKFVEIAL